MKIVYIPSWYPILSDDLTGIFIKEQIEILSSSLDQADVLFVKGEKFRVFKKWVRRDEKGGDEFFYFTPYMPKLSKSLFKRWLKNYNIAFQLLVDEKGKPDIIHAHGYMAGIAAYSIAQKFKIPYIITIHDSSLILKEFKFWKLNYIKSSFNHAYKCIAVSNFLKEVLKEKYKYKGSVVIPNFVHDQFLKVKTKSTRSGVYTFGLLGALDTGKRNSLALRAFRLLLERVSREIKLHIVGRGEEYKILQKRIKKFHLEEKVKLKGWISRKKLPEFFEHIDCLISVSELETFGINLIEALASGKPVLSFNSGGPADIVTEEVGLLIENDSVISISNGMEEIMSRTFNPEQLQNYAIQHFGSKVVKDQILEIYHSLS